MSRIKYAALVISGSLFLFSVLPLQADETVYGWQLMSEQERNEHREKMQSMRTEQEREAYRMEHHKMMQERATEQGINLPEPQDRRRDGMPNRMDGSGMGSGGMGSGGMGNRR
ncbi:MAG: hypothetical protein OEX03_10535 [Gammaproteobacteria bacterium]|nr:hypothetical protein [Gammaproteobacteria bacterium]